MEIYFRWKELECFWESGGWRRREGEGRLQFLLLTSPAHDDDDGDLCIKGGVCVCVCVCVCARVRVCVTKIIMSHRAERRIFLLKFVFFIFFIFFVFSFREKKNCKQNVG